MSTADMNVAEAEMLDTDEGINVESLPLSKRILAMNGGVCGLGKAETEEINIESLPLTKRVMAMNGGICGTGDTKQTKNGN